MILQALTAYYERLKTDVDSGIPLYGYEVQKISFALVLENNGSISQVKDLRYKNEKGKLVSKNLVLPSLGKKRASGIEPNFLWDNTAYVLGRDDKGKPKRALECFDEFRKLHHQLLDNTNEIEGKTLLAFLDIWNPDNAEVLEFWEEMAGTNIVFIVETNKYLHETQSLQSVWNKHIQSDGESEKGICLVTGEVAPLAQLHSAIKGVKDAQSSGAGIISFNKTSFVSFEKRQNLNAPVSKKAAFAYTTTLNHLLSFESRQKIQIGDATTVFWTEKPSLVEGFMGMLFDPKEDSGLLQDLKLFLDAARKGERLPKVEDPSVPFYILGLSPNASRISVRFWHVSTIDEISKKLSQHFEDLSIIKEWENDPDYPPLWRLLVQTAREGKTLKDALENVQPLLAGAMMRSILTGSDYPQTLLARVLERIRAEQSKKDKNGRDINNVNYFRAAILKACLVRKSRLHNKPEWEVKMSLDKENNQPAYRLGRLFCVLEKVQKDAIPGANSTIKDRFYGSASTTPAVVFPRLIKNAQHHIQKAEYGGIREKLMEEILNPVKDFPVRLTLEEQGLFALGYYHQKKDLYTKKEEK